MATSTLLWVVALSLMVSLNSACQDGKFDREYTSDCCGNSLNTGGIFGEAKCCRDADDRTKCYCDSTAEMVGEDCKMVSTTPAPTTTTEPTTTTDATTTMDPMTPSTGGSTTTPAGGSTTMPAGGPPTITMGDTTAASTPTSLPTTTQPPTTTPQPLCVLPEPTSRLLNSVVVEQCDENGLVAIYVNGGSFTNFETGLVCHGVYIYDSMADRREIYTTEYCWKLIEDVYKNPSFTVTGVIQQTEFPIKECLIEETSTDLGITKISLIDLMQSYLDGIGDRNGCSTLGCMATPTIRPRLTSNCFVTSYGTDDSTADVGVGMLGEARKVEVYSDGRVSQCNDQTTPISYPDITGLDLACYLATAGSGGANCQLADASAPVFCWTDTNEAVLVAFTIANENCNSTQNTFKAILV